MRAHATICFPRGVDVDWVMVYEAAVRLHDATAVRRLSDEWRRWCRSRPHRKKTKELPWWVSRHAVELGVPYSRLLEAALATLYLKVQEVRA